MQETSFVEEGWDKKKIIIFFVVLVFLAGVAVGVKVLFFKDVNLVKLLPLKTTVKENKSEQKKVLGEQETFSTQKINNALEEKLESVKEQVSNLNISNVASSSPQIKKVIEDLQSLQSLPKNQAKDACRKICDGI